ncbi:MAG: MFS transporter [Muribaculaceae bacterium]|nr:MFS transporter [Muribaculaceae bacterium]
MTDQTSPQAHQGGKTIAIIVGLFLFGMIAFVTNLAAPIGTIWGYQFQGSSFLGMLGNMMNFLAYLFMGIPAGKLLSKLGYKKTTLWALAIGAIGMAVQYASSVFGGEIHITDSFALNFIIYLLGAFIAGFCVCMLNTVVNPLLNVLGGGGNKGMQLLQVGGTLNSLTATLTPFLVGVLIGALTPRTTLGDVAPLLWIAIGVFVAAFIILSFVTIPEPNEVGKKEKVKFTHSPWNFRHFVLGAIAIFIYVGIEVGIPGTLLFYLSDQTEQGAGILGDASTIAGAVVAIYWMLMLVGRLISSVISGKISVRNQLIAVSGMGIILAILAICCSKDTTIAVPSFIVDSGAQIPIAACFLVLCGLCTSVMWGAIFNLATEGLGKYTAQASGIFMMMVVGGGVIPLVQQLIAGAVGYMTSYWLQVACLGFLFLYGIWGCINVNKDIPVEDEDAKVLEQEILNAE